MLNVSRTPQRQLKQKGTNMDQHSNRDHEYSNIPINIGIAQKADMLLLNPWLFSIQGLKSSLLKLHHSIFVQKIFKYNKVQRWHKDLINQTNHMFSEAQHFVPESISSLFSHIVSLLSRIDSGSRLAPRNDHIISISDWQVASWWKP